MLATHRHSLKSWLHLFDRFWISWELGAESGTAKMATAEQLTLSSVMKATSIFIYSLLLIMMPLLEWSPVGLFGPKGGGAAGKHDNNIHLL